MLGKTLGHYRVLEQIGAGGMGVVYRARDEHLDREVAIKVLPPSALADDESRRRFRKEALALSKLNHANIAIVHDFHAQDGVDYLVMELVPGESLAQKLQAGPLPEKKCASLGEQIASALQEAHQRGVIHRDLKPGNVLITPHGQAKVLDFGLAELLPQFVDEVATASVMHGQHAVGTLPYMSPEQLRAAPLDARTDIYAIGVVLYEMATGRRPFDAKVATALVADIQNKLPEPPRLQNSRLSPEFERIILKCLEKDPENRYQSAKELSVDLRRLNMPATATQPVPRPQSNRFLLAVLGIAAVILVLSVLVGLDVGGLRTGLTTRLSGTPTIPVIESLAVLPLDNLSGDASQEYFADGMTEALITELAQISALKKVTSRTSVMQYKTNKKTMPEIARELGVDAVIEGSVQRSGQRVAITVQLIDPAADRHLWAKAYERDASDILSLQREVARAIAAEIRVQLTPQEQARLSATQPVNPVAHNAYLLGRFYTEKRTREDFDKAIESLNEAIRIDPQFAPAHAALSRAYAERDIWDGRFGLGASAPVIREAALRALALDPNLAEAHLAMAAVRGDYDWDWQGAEAEYQRALELNPNFPDALHLSAFLLQALGRHEEAIARIRRAVQLAPTVVRFVDSEGRILYRARRYEEAIAAFQRALAIDASYPPIYFRLTDAYLAAGKFKETFQIIERGNEVRRDPETYRRRLAYAYARTGRKQEALDLLQILQREKVNLGAYELAAAYAALGDKDRAIALLDDAVQKHAMIPVWFRDPKFDPLRSDPRFKALIRRMNLPE